MDESVNDILNSLEVSNENSEIKSTPQKDYKEMVKDYGEMILEFTPLQELNAAFENLENGKIPILDKSKTLNWVKAADPELPEEILMWLNGIQDKFDERSIFINQVIETIEDVADEKYQYFLKTYAELVDYHPAFCRPIIDRSPAFFSSFEEMDIMHFAMQASILKELKLININLKELIKKVNK